MEIVSIIGYAASIIGISSFLPQLIKVIKTKHTKDLSLPMFSLFCTSVALWTAYGLMKKDLPIIITNSLVLLQALIILAYKIKYK
ncbi:SemiSWEET transporter [Candidatus Woesearchaeota archaeon]|nr:SemiSWEET transporter [Candidatus Woesearchaeota archaeon]